MKNLSTIAFASIFWLAWVLYTGITSIGEIPEQKQITWTVVPSLIFVIGFSMFLGGLLAAAYIKSKKGNEC